MRKRWLSILGLTVAGTGGGVVLSLLLTPVSSWLTGLPGASFWTMVLGAAALAAVLFLKAAWRGWRACLGLRHFWRYPPPWIASLLGTAIVLWLWRLTECPIKGISSDLLGESLGWVVWVLLAVLVLGSVGEVPGLWRRVPDAMRKVGRFICLLARSGAKVLGAIVRILATLGKTLGFVGKAYGRVCRKFGSVQATPESSREVAKSEAEGADWKLRVWEWVRSIGGSLYEMLCFAAWVPGFLCRVRAFLSRLLSLAWRLVRQVGRWLGPLLPESKGKHGQLEQVKDSQSAQPEFDLSSYDKIVDWLKTDDAIDDPSRDRLDHDKIARRIVRRLASNENGDRPPTIAVIGPLGSGKTTIAKLVERRAKKVPGLEIVRLSLWQYDSSEAAVRGILSALIKKLGEHVNTWPLAGLRDEYVSLIEKAGGRWGGFARCLRGLQQPKDVIEKFGEIAGAVGISVVMWIEDMERFASGESDFKAADPHVVERLNPIRSLLHLLDQSEHISVIVADCSLDSRFDLEKIARYVERIPELDPEWVRQVSRVFRDGCLKEPEGLIDPMKPKLRDEFLCEPHGDWLLKDVWSDEPINMEKPAAICTLLSTPRDLKNSLRETLDVWKVLPGEIDLDIVLVASVIRVARPSLFAVFARHVSVLLDGFGGVSAHRRREPQEHRAFVEFQSHLEDEANDYARAAVECLSRFLFPTLPCETGPTPPPKRVRRERPQGFVGGIPADYWQRYLDLCPIPEPKSDQAALRALEGWRAGEENDLLDRICDEEKAGGIERFARQFQMGELIRLLTELVEMQVTRSARFWRFLELLPGGEPIHLMFQLAGVDGVTLQEARCDLIRKFGHRNLPLMLSLNWAFPSGKEFNRSTEEEKQRKREFVEQMRQATLRWATETPPEALDEALHRGPYYLLLALVSALTPWREIGDKDIRFTEWERFAGALLNAADSNRHEMLPYILPFFAHYSEPIKDITGEILREEKAVFDVDEAKKLFDFPQLRKIIAESEIPDLEANVADAPEEHRERLKQDAKAVRKMWEAAREACRNLPDEG